jgi:hypothetical protein
MSFVTCVLDYDCHVDCLGFERFLGFLCLFLGSQRGGNQNRQDIKKTSVSLPVPRHATWPTSLLVNRSTNRSRVHPMQACGWPRGT